MKFEKQLSSLMTAALLCGTFTTLSSGAADSAASGVVAYCRNGVTDGCSFAQVNSSAHRG